MESTLNARLINRRTGPASLTRAGEELRARAEAIAGEVDSIERHVTGRDAELAGPLRVTCTNNFANRYLAPHFAQFARHHPGIDL